jgi:hypothetical protein
MMIMTDSQTPIHFEREHTDDSCSDTTSGKISLQELDDQLSVAIDLHDTEFSSDHTDEFLSLDATISEHMLQPLSDRKIWNTSEEKETLRVELNQNENWEKKILSEIDSLRHQMLYICSTTQDMVHRVSKTKNRESQRVIQPKSPSSSKILVHSPRKIVDTYDQHSTNVSQLFLRMERKSASSPSLHRISDAALAASPTSVELSHTLSRASDNDELRLVAFAIILTI